MTRPEEPPATAGPAGRDGARSVDALRQAAFAHHRRGELDQATALYRQLLEVAPEDPGGLNGLGCLLHQRGDSSSAVKLLARAVAVAPQAADAQGNYGHCLAALGRLEEACLAYEASLALSPDQAALWHALATLRDHLFDGTGAIEAARRLVALAQAEATCHAQLGQLYRKEARLAEAVTSFTEAQRLAPNDIALAQQIAQALSEDDRPEAAEQSLREAFDQTPGEASLAIQLGQLLVLEGRSDAAVAVADRLLSAGSADDDSVVLAANHIYQLAHQTEKSLSLMERALRDRPQSIDLIVTQASLLQAAGKIEQAILASKQALSLEPGHAGAHLTIGLAHQDRSEIASAHEAFRSAANAEPSQAALRSALVVSLNYDPKASEEQLWHTARDWNERFAAPLAKAIRPHENGIDPLRPLRIGYVSPDFRRHSVAYFAEPLLEHHDRAAFEVYCYAELAKLDDTSHRFKKLADHWRNTVGQGDRQVAAQIRADKIDILVDLAGHTAGNRLCAFALKPAPIQVTWLGYPGTTGLDAMDYRLTDAVCDPPGEADRWHSENLIRLPNGFLCFRPDESAPAVAPPPCLVNGYPTFGSFNNPAKISEPVIEIWSALMRRLPDARLLLKGRGLGEPETRKQLGQRFVKRGISIERLDLRDHLTSTHDHLNAYAEVDVALDSFPYNGTTTTLEALWMGVPVVTLEGDRHAGRVGMSLLQRIGQEELVAPDHEAYAASGGTLAAAPDRLARLRRELRARLRGSPLLDGPAFTAEIERRYRELWTRHCESHGQV